VAVLAVAALVGACCWLSLGASTGVRRLSNLSGVPRRTLFQPRRWLTGRPRRERSSGSSAELPSALDLLAACVSAGALLESALAAVACAFDGPVGELLSDIARLTALGAPPEDAWSAALRDQRWAPAARAVIRAHHSGAAVADVLNRVATDLRRDVRAQAEVAAARASVKAVLPLGLCFLPAFLLMGVVPVVAGFTTALW
jgi:pilus assembly protein TadC